jgi:hypothetical protein
VVAVRLMQSVRSMRGPDTYANLSRFDDAIYRGKGEERCSGLVYKDPVEGPAAGLLTSLLHHGFISLASESPDAPIAAADILRVEVVEIPAQAPEAVLARF